MLRRMLPRLVDCTLLFRPGFALTVCGVLLLGVPGALASPAPLLDHVIVIVMENKSYDEVRTAPYTASLVASGTSFSNSFAVTHPSQPNYLALWAGSTMGVDDTCPAPGSPYASENLGHACEAAGVTWRTYSENLPSAGSPECSWDSSLYVRKHDPWTDWSNLHHLNERPFTDLQVDIDAGTLPRLAFVIPNNCDNTHNCPVSTGDAWLMSNVPAMLQAVGSRGMVVLTWDEDDHSSANHILTVFVGPPVLANHVSTQLINHYTLLRTLCEALGVQPFAAAAAESSITDVWQNAGPGRVPDTIRLTRPSPDKISITWSTSCTAGVQDYGIYEGQLGQWYSHTAIDCVDDLHDLTETVVSSPGDRYYLVVPLTSNTEGSYGVSSVGAELPPGSSTCRASQISSSCQ